MNQSPVEKAPLTHKMLLTFHLPRGQRQRIKIIGFRYLLRMQKNQVKIVFIPKAIPKAHFFTIIMRNENTMSSELYKLIYYEYIEHHHIFRRKILLLVDHSTILQLRNTFDSILMAIFMLINTMFSSLQYILFFTSFFN